jgi:hypothetical protein
MTTCCGYARAQDYHHQMNILSKFAYEGLGQSPCAIFFLHSMSSAHNWNWLIIPQLPSFPAAVQKGWVLSASGVFVINMFALRTRHMCYNSTCLTHIAPRRTQYCTITSKTRERIRSKSSPNRGVHTSAHRFVDREPKVNFETAEHVSDIGTPGNQDSVHSDTSWTNFGSGTRGSSTPVTGSGHEQDVSKSSTRTGIDQLRRYLGRPQTTIHPSELDNSEVQIAFDPDYDVVDSATYDADGYTVHIPGEYCVAQGCIDILNKKIDFS